jgi:asparagine synthase (glutamine-hydrolysing)
MCGFFGFVGDRERAGSLDLDAALAALRHRGPDDRGVLRRLEGEPACVLAHTRLSIIDLSPAGHQPMTTEDGRYTIVYNGEVYNFRELAKELEKVNGADPFTPAEGAPGERASLRGSFWRSNTDTEVVLKAYAAWGKDCVRRFRGMFAFAIWDAKERTLFLARDRMGIKPLYYALGGRGLAFASEVRALLATGAAERRLSPFGLASYVAFGSVSEPHTVLDGVFSLSPGHVAEYAGGELRSSSYWEIPFGENGPRHAGEAVERLRPLLKEAVALRLVSDVPLGVFLSGGVDSAAVTALAAEASLSPIHTFTVTFDEESYDEAAYAAETARRFGCDHHQVHLPVSHVAAELDTALLAMDQPSADGLNTYFVSRAAREAGLTVALSGLGGDEIFAGYSSFRTFGKLLRAGRAGRLLGGRALDSVLGESAFNGVPNRWKKLGAALASKGDMGMTYTVRRSMFDRRQGRELLHPAFAAVPTVSAAIPEAVAGVRRRGSQDAVNALTALELSNYLRNTLLRDADANSMANSLEVRVPLLDHLLVELAARIPGEMKLSPGRNKPLLVDAVESLPFGLASRPKVGFTLPLETWFRGPLRGRLRELLFGAPAPAWSGPGIERLWKSFLHGARYTSHSRVWTVAALNAWCGNNSVRN